MIQGIIDALLNLFGFAPKRPADEVLTELATKRGYALNWRTSIVDLLKLLDMDFSIDARRKLATELGYTGNHPDGSAEKNIWLLAAVKKRVGSHGIKL